jgi:acetyl-CoA synthetase
MPKCPFVSLPSAQELDAFGLAPDELSALLSCFPSEPDDDGEAAWTALRSLLKPSHPFALHQLLYAAAYAAREPARGPAPAWSPSPEQIAANNLGEALQEQSWAQLHAASVASPETWWATVIEALSIHFRTEPSAILEPDEDPSQARWLPGARLNIAESCFTGRDNSAIAVIWADEDGALQTLSLAELRRRANEVAWAIQASGLLPGDAIAICMPMTPEAVAIYLGIVLAGGVVVSIADSFAPEEIATRIRISSARAIFTQDVIRHGGRDLPLYARVLEAEAPMTVVLPAGDQVGVELREGDKSWDEFIVQGGSEGHFEPCIVPADTTSNILFSSGTTGEPKAIPWTHITPIKAAADGWAHHSIQPGDVVAWPTNLGWMMGPWLIYAALLRGAAIALYCGSPTGEGFCRFVQDAGVTMLGLVPSIVRAWRASDATEGLDWSPIRCFSSTDEASNAEDSLWLMSRVRGYRPIVEYCGGTEIGGGYICGSTAQPQAPATFSSPAMGCDFVIIDEEGRSTDLGELALLPPILGTSNRLLNRDHDSVYYAEMPPGPERQVLRRHGDQMERLRGGYYRAHGRVDDTLNLGGIRISSADIERVCNEVPGLLETAAIAVSSPGGGPNLLVVHAVLDPADSQLSTASPEDIRLQCQQRIRSSLNPLFKVHELRVEEELPRTASGKVMRRVLRARYSARRPPV